MNFDWTAGNISDGEMCYAVGYCSWRRGESLIAWELLEGGFRNEEEGTVLHHALMFWVFGGP